MDNTSELTPEIKSGVAELRQQFSPLLLTEVATRKKERISFDVILPDDYLGISRILHIGFPEDYPLVTPVISVSPNPWLEWPHVMDNGICLFSAGNSAVYGDGREVLSDTINRVKKLIHFVSPSTPADERKAEFEREILSYWVRQLSVSSRKLLLLNTPSVSSPLFALTPAKNQQREQAPGVWLSDSPEVIIDYCNKNGTSVRKQINLIQAAFYVKLRTIPDVRIPAADNFIDWLKDHILPQEKELLQKWSDKHTGLPCRWVIADIPGPGPKTLYAFQLERKSVRSGAEIIYGLRAGKKNITPATVSREDKVLTSESYLIDNSSIFSRTRDLDLGRLAGQKVLLIGAGSLGSQVAMQLVHSGVTHLTILDPDTLSDTNLGRHVLSCDYLGCNKALGMRDHLEKCIPTARVKAIPSYFHRAIIDKKIKLLDFNCIISTSADWGAEYHLWLFKSESTRFSVIQGWTEPFALVGHALGCPASVKGDARHLFDRNGAFLKRFSEWPNNGVVNIPACGAGFIAGNAVNIQTIAAMITHMALSYMQQEDKNSREWHSFITESDSIKKNGGTYHGPALSENTLNQVIKNEW
ncbi:ThiF family adenylyltransferase [Enterobacter sp.]|uniref:ThiF family adenylyltransferase n=1 Tax=Enterobacter sp. TaxID=42895 RepID=UPI003D10E051